MFSTTYIFWEKNAGTTILKLLPYLTSKVCILYQHIKAGNLRIDEEIFYEWLLENRYFCQLSLDVKFGRGM
jgi:hypothetical protein